MFSESGGLTQLTSLLCTIERKLIRKGVTNE